MSNYSSVKLEFDKYGEFLPVLGTVQELRYRPTGNLRQGDMIKTSGNLVYNDGIGADWVWDPSSQAVDDGITVIQPGFLPAGRWIKTIASQGIVENQLGTATNLAPSQAAVRARFTELLGSTGASQIGYNQGLPGAVTRTLQDKLRDEVNAMDLGAAGNGTTDDRAALQKGVNVPLIITANHRISGNITFNNPVTFQGNGRLTIDAGVTVTFNNGVNAPEQQIFYGGGVVSSCLRVCFAAWFAGDLINTGTDALTLLQKAYDATAQSGVVNWPYGSFTISGVTPINILKGQSTIGKGKFATYLYFTGPTTNGFAVSQSIGARFRDLTVQISGYDVVPTDGTAIRAGREYTEISNVLISGAWVGLEFPQTSGNSKCEHLDVLDCRNIGIFVHDINDVWFNQFFVVAIARRLTFSSAVNFAPQEVITFAGGGQAQIMTKVNSTTYRMQVYDRNPAVGENATGTSGAVGTVSNVDLGHKLGGIRLANKAEAINFADGDVIGGRFAMTITAGSNVPGIRPAYSKFTSVYFDSADEGVAVDNCAEISFNDCWFSNRPSSGIVINNCDGVKFTGGGAVNCGQNGVIVGSSAKRTTFGGGFSARGNSTNNPNEFSGIAVSAGTTDFLVQNCILGGSLGFGTQKYGINVLAGASDRYVIKDNLIAGNQTAGLFDGGTGPSKKLQDNY